MIKNKQKIILCVVGIAAVIIGAKLLLISPQHTLVPTKDISHEQPIGGAPKTATANSAAAVTQPTKHTASVSPMNQQEFKARTTPANAPEPFPESTTTPPVTEYKYRALGNAPNDPYYTSAWELQKINATNAWNITTGNSIIVADIDTGYALQHEDLVNSWYQNPGETNMTKPGGTCWTGVPKDKASNGCDDDSNGYIDDWRGWNFYGRYQPTADPCAPDGMGTYVDNNNPQAGQSGDDTLYQEYTICTGMSTGDPYAAISHGTSTAGLIGATTNNSVGTASLNWNVKIMPLQALGDDGSGWTSDISRAVKYAVDNGAQIINMSLGGSELDATLQSAVDYAYQHNVVVVAAAGNCGTGTEFGCDPTKPGAMLYPALYPHVLSVGSSAQSDARATFSSYGRGLDILAPGVGAITSPLIDTRVTPFNYTNAYSASLAGTSFSSPLVASVASLVRSLRPSSSVDDIRALLLANARKPAAMNGALYTNEYGHGIVDAGSAATIAQALQLQGATVPTYGQTGNYQSEHTYRAADTLSSGCTTAALYYCTVRWTETATGFERYLPYKQANANGQASWQWSGVNLNYGEWWGVAQSGDKVSTTSYQLFAK